MAQPPKAKPKRKKPKNTDKKQSWRFIETAKTLGTEEDGSAFERAMKKLLSPSKPKPKDRKDSA